jgi:hypothetical protein
VLHTNLANAPVAASHNVPVAASAGVTQTTTTDPAIGSLLVVLFRALHALVKTEYRKENLFTMPQLLNTFRSSKHVSIHKAHPENFHDWESYQNLFCGNFTMKGKCGIIDQNHCFLCN